MNLALAGLEFRQRGFHLKVDCLITAPITGLFGPSGAGKTTLLELIAGLRKAHSGSIHLAGTLLNRLPPEARQVGYVPQDLALFPHQSVEQNLRFSPASTDAQFTHIVESLSLRSLLQRRPSEISGGEKQRVAIGRALMRSPRLLLLDEPLSSLDLSLKIALLELLRSAAAEFKTPMLYVTHDASELAAICDEVIVLENGVITRQGKFDSIFERFNQPGYRLAR